MVITLAEYLLHVLIYIMLREEPPKICSMIPTPKSSLAHAAICFVANDSSMGQMLHIGQVYIS